MKTVTLWVRYDPQRNMIRDTARFKWMLPEPSKAGGDVLIKLTGNYAPATRHRNTSTVSE